jgi:serine O-acetyltransferase
MFDNIRADLRHYSRYCYHGKPVWRTVLRTLYTHPASVGVVWWRFGSAAWRMRVPVAQQLFQFVYLVFLPLVRMYSGVHMRPDTVVGPGLAVLHGGGVVIARGTTIGGNCLLHQDVNIVAYRDARGASIGSNFYAGVGVIIIDAVIIEDNVTAGAGCVITKSVPRDAVVAGVPARILRYREPRENPAENRTLRSHRIGWLGAPKSQSHVCDGRHVEDRSPSEASSQDFTSRAGPAAESV